MSVRKMEVPEMEWVDQKEAGTQQVAVMEKIGTVDIKYAKIPHAKSGEIRVDVKWVGICGSDLEVYRGARTPEFLSYPMRLGHEVAGIVDEVGPDVVGINVGDHVSLRYVWGAFAEYITCDPFSAVVLPKEFPLMHGSLIEITPTIQTGMERADINQAKNVLIMGQGVSGLQLTQFAHLYSPRNLVVTDLFDEKLEIAKEFGANKTYKIPSEDTPTMDVVGKDFPDGFDVVIPARLEGDSVIDALDCCAQDARLIMYGGIGKTSKTIDFFKMHRRRVDILTTEPKRDVDNHDLFRRGRDMVINGLINTEKTVTNIFPLSKIGEAFSLRNQTRGDVIHVMIDCDSTHDDGRYENGNIPEGVNKATSEDK
ncbi:zinc-dependent alcohol dehydrogenase [Paucilactobacillus vaccinostercus]|nr:alcohol dehydrogenase catalytic domain-containing protein [Paucilactobacillus vaccinostercus]